MLKDVFVTGVVRLRERCVAAYLSLSQNTRLAKKVIYNAPLSAFKVNC